MKKVLITGVTGFIGGSLARKLLSEGITVYGVDIETTKLNEFKKYDNFIPVIATFEDYALLPSRIHDKEIEVFFHFAWAGGFTSAIKDYKLQMSNAVYAGDALIAAKNIGCKKFVYAGTYNQYEIQNFLKTSGFEPRYTCIYSTGKTAAGLICRTLAYNLGIEYSAGLIPMPYGENNYSKQLVNIVIDNLNKGIAPKLVEGNNKYDLIYIGDLVDALFAIGEKGKDQHEYYVGHRNLKTFKELMSDIRNVIAPNVELKFGEYKDAQNIDYSKIDLDALYRDTGFECKANFNKTIRLTSEWVKQLSL
jgi:nucleoside-diphosphate-sugar epimerase